MGMLTATGGGVIRDMLTNEKPMITSGQLYATVALAGAGCYALLYSLGTNQTIAVSLAFVLAFAMRAAAIIFDIRMGPPGEFIRIGTNKSQGEDTN